MPELGEGREYGTIRELQAGGYRQRITDCGAEQGPKKALVSVEFGAKERHGRVFKQKKQISNIVLTIVWTLDWKG